MSTIRTLGRKRTVCAGEPVASGVKRASPASVAPTSQLSTPSNVVRSPGGAVRISQVPGSEASEPVAAKGHPSGAAVVLRAHWAIRSVASCVAAPSAVSYIVSITGERDGVRAPGRSALSISGTPRTRPLRLAAARS
ncbi:hypothetical protein GCM10009592_11780 [Brachybacterium rhamnosum]